MRRDQGLRFILTTDTYAAAGAVIVNNARYIGFDTSGRQLFDRKDYDGALAAVKQRGLHAIAPGYYGVSSERPEGVSSAQYLRDQDAEKAARAAREADQDAWLPLGKASAERRREYDPDRRIDVLGEVTQAPAGNTVLRTGHLLTDATAKTPFSRIGWNQAGHLVLTPAERDWLIVQLQEHAAKHPAQPAEDVAA